MFLDLGEEQVHMDQKIQECCIPQVTESRRTPEREVVQDMYEEVGYSAKQGFINLEVNH